MRVGILAFQGAFAKHSEMLLGLGCETQFVRSTEELFSCDALIIPGGESTVIGKEIRETQLRAALLLFAKSKPVFGTCAGLIIMAQEKLLDIEIERNAYGRQVDSFSTDIVVNIPNKKEHVHAIFIRAPKITKILSSQVEVLATYDQTPVLIKQGHCLGCSFHPELTKDSTIHQYFIREVQHAQSGKKRSLLCYR